MGWIWNALDYLGTFVLGIIGVFLAVFPRDRSNIFAKGVWISVVGVLTLLGALFKAKQDNALETKISGGANYCVIELRPSAEVGKFVPQLANSTGLVPGVTFAFHRTEGEQAIQFSEWSKWGPCLKTTVDQRFELSEGQYRIDFVATNGIWRQWLRLWKEGGVWMQTTKIIHEERGLILPETTKRLAGN